MSTGTTSSARRTIGNFNGDFQQLSDLMERSWSENKEQPLHYSGSFLSSAFEYPGSSFELAPAIYRDGRLVAFVAGFPRTLRIAGQVRRLLSISYLTVAPEYKHAGYGPVLWGELLKRARAMGYDGALDFSVEGDPWNRQIPAVARLLRQPTTHIFTVSYMAKILKGDELKSGPDMRDADCDMPALLCEAATQISRDVPLVRDWSKEEAQWQCCRRSAALNTVMRVDGRHGILNGYAISVSGSTPMPVAILDNILWGKLALSECVELAKALVGNATRAGVRMIVTPVLGYADMQPLAAAGFRKTRRLLHAYLTAWTFTPPASIPSMYIDVF